MSPALSVFGTSIQIILILAAFATAFSMAFGIRTMTAALACLALSFVGMAINGQPAAILAVSMGALMELRLPARRRHKGLLEWLLVSVGLCQVALALTQEFGLTFWIAQSLGFLVILFSLAATFAPQWWRTPDLAKTPALWHPTDRSA